MFVFFGIAALLLAAIGLYGVMAFSVSRRTHELGLRVTLGAQTGDVLKLILGKALFQLGVGSILGLSLGLALSHLVEGFLYGVGAWDFPAFLMVIVTMMASGIVACIVPVHRALRIEPAIALRYE
jgi:putative ABC transport system permease protein